MGKKTYSILITVGLILIFLTGKTCAQKPIFETSLAASGQSETILTIEKWGRYSLEVEGSEGTAIQLIDKKTGIREQSGIVGEKNGRIDAFLDFGHYKIVAQSHPKGKTQPKLKVYPFQEFNLDNPQYLIPFREYEENLKDHEQRSYWIYLPNDTTVFLEVLGRNVADVQLWQNGQWRVDIKRSSICSYPSTKQPLKGFRIIQYLKAGYYQLSIYGGPVAQWAEQSEKHPLYFRWNLPRFAATGVGVYTVSPVGYTQFLVKSTDYISISSTDKKKTLILSAVPYNENSSSFSGGSIDSIYAKATEPVCSVKPYNSNSGYYVVKVAGAPGRKFTLKTLNYVNSTLFLDTAITYWLSTLHSGYVKDQIGVTGGVVCISKHHEIVQASIDTIDSKRRIKRSFNCLGSISLHIWIGEEGKYDFIPDGTDMNISVRRFMTDTTFSPIDQSSSKISVELEKGMYLVELNPRVNGIGTLEVKRSTLLGLAKDLVGMQGEQAMPSPNIQFPSLQLQKKKSYNLFINSLSPEITGLIFRSLPLDLDEPLPVYVCPNKPVSFPVIISETSILNVTDEQGKNYKYQIDGKPGKNSDKLEKGTYTISLSSDSLVCLIAQTVRASRLPSAGPKPFPTGKESPLPLFDEISVGKPSFFTLNSSDFKVFEFTIDEPGVYRFETTGRLRTSLTLRDRFIVRTYQEEANGIGRNALIQAYFLPGRYQAIAMTEGQSAGRLGIQVVKNEMMNGGMLTTKREKRHLVPLGAGIIYQIEIPEEASYHIVSQGQAATFKGRFDDAQGWPLIQPGDQADFTRKLKAGSYYLLSLPEKRESIRIATVTLTDEIRGYPGKGPHLLTLNKTAQSVWMEDSSSNIRRPAVFTIALPAPALYRLSVSDGFNATISKDSVNQFKWVGVKDTLLSMGFYTITVLAEKPQNLAEYHLSVSTSTLVTGISLPVTTYNEKETYRVSVGKKTVVELFSQGMRDVEGVLKKENCDTVLASNDDGTNDWNFKISRVLEPGFYTLEVNNRGSSRGISNVVMVSLEDTVYKDWELNTTKKVNLDGKIITIPLPGNIDAEIANITVSGGSRVGATIERKGKNGSFTIIGQRESDTLSLSAVLEKSNSYRLRLWSTDHLNENVDVTVTTGALEDVTIWDLIKGVKTKGFTTGILTSVWFRVDFQDDSLNHYRFTAVNSPLAVRSCIRNNSIFETDFEDFVSVSRKTVYVELQFDKEGKQSIKAEALNLESEKTLPASYIPRVFSCKKQDNAITLFKVHMNSGTPMCGVYTVGTGDFSPAGFPVWKGAFQDSHDAVCVSLPDETYCFFAWNADVKTSKSDNNMTLQTATIKISEQVSLMDGTQKWVARGPDTKTYSYKSKFGSSSIKVIVPKNGIIVWKRPDGSRTCFSTNKNIDYVTLDEREGVLYCINTTVSEGFFSIDCLPAENSRISSVTASVIEPDKNPFEYNFPHGGEQQIAINCSMSDLSKYRLFVHNSSKVIDWWSGNGMMTHVNEKTGEFPVNDLPVYRPEDRAGFVSFEHNPGWVVASLYDKKSENMCWGKDLKVSKSFDIKSSQIVTMQDGVNWFTLTVDKPVQVQISTDVSCIGILMKNNNPVKTFIGTDGFRADIPLTAGVYEFGIRSAGGASFNGVPVTFVYKTIDVISEDKAPHVRLASGESSILQFTLDKKRTIGIGLKTDREVIEAKLFANDFNIVCEGQQQFVTLDKGTYYLWLHVPYDQDAAECEVMLAGQNPPSDMPPESEIRKFKNEE